ncbi:MAG TPA: phospho-N-acetylmuramoyl-pentapeptide-transferase [Thermomicrobiaceae bacterium]|nr:phospho-N-acetylmuramoyl-pentapeptide-transferase [Thermomicrobiaceae bacterium]
MIPVLGMMGVLGHNLRHYSVMPQAMGTNLAASMGLSALSFILTIVVGRPYIRFLKDHKVGKQVRVEEPEGHAYKTGTPTMGGLMITVPVIVTTIIFNLTGRLSMLLPVGVLAGAAILGALDDRMSLVGSKRGGMTARLKMLWLLLLAIAAALILYFPLGLRTIYVPWLGKYDIGPIYIVLAVIGIAGSANAVNLTDGLDSLAGGTAAVAFVAYGIIAYLQGQVQVVTFCFMMVGGLLGFLWFNAHPAQVIMGDTGALAIGAALATAAFMTGQWLLLPVVGFVFVMETVSVMMQVSYFKWTKGKRIFKSTPIHIHFELLGWSETQVTMRFWLIGMMVGLLGVALAMQ